jgi:phosphatidate cytidylyltransferase
VSAAPEQASGLSELNKRILSGIVMAAVAIGTTIIGGWIFAIVWFLAALAVAYEWQRLVQGDAAMPATLASVAVVTAAAVGAFWTTLLFFGLAVLLLAMVWLAAAADHRPAAVTGAVYAAALGASMLLCRSTDYNGAIIIFWLFAVVWGTDILAYFTGRSLGGPRLWPRVSPKKTWSGATGGLLGGVLLGCLVIAAFGVSVKWQHFVLSIAFSVLTQCGDLYESAIKRRYNVKDSGNLIPGHGGFMDRLDGFIFAVVFAALFGAARAGLGNVPQGLLFWP